MQIAQRHPPHRRQRRGEKSLQNIEDQANRRLGPPKPDQNEAHRKNPERKYRKDRRAPPPENRKRSRTHQQLLFLSYGLRRV